MGQLTPEDRIIDSIIRDAYENPREGEPPRNAAIRAMAEKAPLIKDLPPEGRGMVARTLQNGAAASQVDSIAMANAFGAFSKVSSPQDIANLLSDEMINNAGVPLAADDKVEARKTLNTTITNSFASQDNSVVEAPAAPTASAPAPAAPAPAPAAVTPAPAATQIAPAAPTAATPAPAQAQVEPTPAASVSNVTPATPAAPTPVQATPAPAPAASTPPAPTPAPAAPAQAPRPSIRTVAQMPKIPSSDIPSSIKQVPASGVATTSGPAATAQATAPAVAPAPTASTPTPAPVAPAQAPRSSIPIVKEMPKISSPAIPDRIKQVPASGAATTSGPAATAQATAPTPAPVQAPTASTPTPAPVAPAQAPRFSIPIVKEMPKISSPAIPDRIKQVPASGAATTSGPAATAPASNVTPTVPAAAPAAQAPASPTPATQAQVAPTPAAPAPEVKNYSVNGKTITFEIGFNGGDLNTLSTDPAARAVTQADGRGFSNAARLIESHNSHSENSKVLNNLFPAQQKEVPAPAQAPAASSATVSEPATRKDELMSGVRNSPIRQEGVITLEGPRRQNQIGGSLQAAAAHSDKFGQREAEINGNVTGGMTRLPPSPSNTPQGRQPGAEGENIHSSKPKRIGLGPDVTASSSDNRSSDNNPGMRVVSTNNVPLEQGGAAFALAQSPQVKAAAGNIQQTGTPSQTIPQGAQSMPVVSASTPSAPSAGPALA